MAEQEHVDMLGPGVVVWNQWREERPKIRPDLNGVHLGQEHTSMVWTSTTSSTGRSGSQLCEPCRYRSQGYELQACETRSCETREYKSQRGAPQ